MWSNEEASQNNAYVAKYSAANAISHISTSLKEFPPVPGYPPPHTGAPRQT